MLDSRTKASGFYRGDAARLVSEAARLPAEPAQVEEPSPPEAPPAPSPVIALTPATPPVLLDDPQRPPLTPSAPINQNLRAPRPEPEDDFDDDPASYWTMKREKTKKQHTPKNAAGAIAALGIDALFIKDLLGL